MSDGSSLVSEALEIVANANEGIPATRRVSNGIVEKVVSRSLALTASLPITVQDHIALRDISDFITLSQQGHSNFKIPRNTDLLPIGHPLSTRAHSMSEASIRESHARWIASDPEIKSDEARSLVASAQRYDTGSIEHSYYMSRIEALPAGMVPLRALIAAFGGGNSSAARSARAKLQRRDRKGRFAWMGGGMNVNIRFPDGSIRKLNGRVLAQGGVNNAGSDDTFDIELSNGRIARVPAGSAEAFKATLPSKDSPDGISIAEAKIKTGDPVIDQANIEYVESPNGFRKDSDYDGPGEKFTDDAYDVIKLDPNSEDYDSPDRTDGKRIDFDKPVYIVRDKDDRPDSGTDYVTQSWADAQDYIRVAEVAKDKKEGRRPPVIAQLDDSQLDKVAEAIGEGEDSESVARRLFGNLFGDDGSDADSKPADGSNVPDGFYKVDTSEAYRPEGRTDQQSEDFTDDPVELAGRSDISDEELVGALKEAVSPSASGAEGTGFGRLSFDAGDESLPAEALYEALNNRGINAKDELDKIYGNEEIARLDTAEPVAKLNGKEYPIIKSEVDSNGTRTTFEEYEDYTVEYVRFRDPNDPAGDRDYSEVRMKRGGPVKRFKGSRAQQEWINEQLGVTSPQQDAPVAEIPRTEAPAPTPPPAPEYPIVTEGVYPGGVRYRTETYENYKIETERSAGGEVVTFTATIPGTNESKRFTSKRAAQQWAEARLGIDTSPEAKALIEPPKPNYPIITSSVGKDGVRVTVETYEDYTIESYRRSALEDPLGERDIHEVRFNGLNKVERFTNLKTAQDWAKKQLGIVDSKEPVDSPDVTPSEPEKKPISEVISEEERVTAAEHSDNLGYGEETKDAVLNGETQEEIVESLPEQYEKDLEVYETPEADRDPEQSEVTDARMEDFVPFQEDFIEKIDNIEEESTTVEEPASTPTPSPIDKTPPSAIRKETERNKTPEQAKKDEENAKKALKESFDKTDAQEVDSQVGETESERMTRRSNPENWTDQELVDGIAYYEEERRTIGYGRGNVDELIRQQNKLEDEQKRRKRESSKPKSQEEEDTATPSSPKQPETPAQKKPGKFYGVDPEGNLDLNIEYTDEYVDYLYVSDPEDLTLSELSDLENILAQVAPSNRRLVARIEREVAAELSRRSEEGLDSGPQESAFTGKRYADEPIDKYDGPSSPYFDRDIAPNGRIRFNRNLPYSQKYVDYLLEFLASRDKNLDDLDDVQVSDLYNILDQMNDNEYKGLGNREDQMDALFDEMEARNRESDEGDETALPTPEKSIPTIEKEQGKKEAPTEALQIPRMMAFSNPNTGNTFGIEIRETDDGMYEVVVTDANGNTKVYAKTENATKANDHFEAVVLLTSTGTIDLTEWINREDSSDGEDALDRKGSRVAGDSFTRYSNEPNIIYTDEYVDFLLDLETDWESFGSSELTDLKRIISQMTDSEYKERFKTDSRDALYADIDRIFADDATDWRASLFKGKRVRNLIENPFEDDIVNVPVSEVPEVPKNVAPDAVPAPENETAAQRQVREAENRQRAAANGFDDQAPDVSFLTRLRGGRDRLKRGSGERLAAARDQLAKLFAGWESRGGVMPRPEHIIISREEDPNLPKDKRYKDRYGRIIRVGDEVAHQRVGDLIDPDREAVNLIRGRVIDRGSITRRDANGRKRTHQGYLTVLITESDDPEWIGREFTYKSDKTEIISQELTPEEKNIVHTGEERYAQEITSVADYFLYQNYYSLKASKDSAYNFDNGNYYEIDNKKAIDIYEKELAARGLIVPQDLADFLTFIDDDALAQFPIDIGRNEGIQGRIFRQVIEDERTRRNPNGGDQGPTIGVELPSEFPIFDNIAPTPPTPTPAPPTPTPPPAPPTPTPAPTPTPNSAPSNIPDLAQETVPSRYVPASMATTRFQGEVEGSPETRGITVTDLSNIAVEPVDSNATQIDYAEWENQRAAEIAEAAKTRESLTSLVELIKENQQNPTNENKRKIEKILTNIYGVGWIQFGPNKFYLRPDTQDTPFTYSVGGTDLKTFSRMEILNEDGIKIGNVHRDLNINLSDPEQSYAYNAFFVISDTSFRGGAADAYNRWMENWYIANGIPSVEVSAAGGGQYTGGAVWALNNFDFKNVSEAKYALERIDSGISGMRQGPARDAAQQDYDRLKAQFDNPSLPNPTPLQIALIGWRPGTKRDWLGYAVMSQRNWRGVKYLKPEAVTQRERVGYDQVMRVARERIDKNTNNFAPSISMFTSLEEEESYALPENKVIAPYRDEIMPYMAGRGGSLARLSPAARTALNVWAANQLNNPTISDPEETVSLMFKLRDESIAYDRKVEDPNAVSALLSVKLADLRDANDNSQKIGDKVIGGPLIINGQNTDFTATEISLDLSGMNATYEIVNTKTGQIFFIKQQNKQESIQEINANVFARAMGAHGTPYVEILNDETLIVTTFGGDGVSNSVGTTRRTEDLMATNTESNNFTLVDLASISVLDAVIVNNDRHSGNWMVTKTDSYGVVTDGNNPITEDSIPILIDHGLAQLDPSRAYNRDPLDYLIDSNNDNEVLIALHERMWLSDMPLDSRDALMRQTALRGIERMERVLSDDLLDSATSQMIIDRLKIIANAPAGFWNAIS